MMATKDFVAGEWQDHHRLYAQSRNYMTLASQQYIKYVGVQWGFKGKESQFKVVSLSTPSINISYTVGKLSSYWIEKIDLTDISPNVMEKSTGVC